MPRKPCRRCGGPKPPGERRRLCDACIPLALEESAQKTRERAKRHYHAGGTYTASVKARATAQRLADPMIANAKVKTSQLRARGVPIIDKLVIPLIVLERHDGICGICATDVDPLSFDVDHITPISLGGEHSYQNTQPAHPSCNRSKGATMQEVYA